MSLAHDRREHVESFIVALQDAGQRPASQALRDLVENYANGPKTGRAIRHQNP